MDTIYGYIERITYYSEEDDYVVARLREKGKRELTTIVGNLAGINPGESLKLQGKWVQNKKYGEQFRVEYYDTVVPATVNGIERYLGSGLIKGIGPVIARRIVKAFGLDTLDIIETCPERLSEVEGIGSKRIDMIKEAWEEQKEIKDVMVFLQGHGVSASYAARIYKKYGNDSIKIVKENPYRLAADVYGIGFITADKIAQSIGINPNSTMRAEEGILFVLSQLMEEGHVYYPLRELLGKTGDLLKLDAVIAEKAVNQLLNDQRLIIEHLDDGQEIAYLPALWAAEENLARRLQALKNEPSVVRPLDIKAALSWVERKLDVVLNEKQKEAISLAVQSKVLIITGGPGTGKTTIINALIKIFRALKLDVSLTAPTGRAAKRMKETTGYAAKTIHRLLEFSPGEGGFRRNQNFPLNADVVIVDEVSMIDTLLMNSLLKAVPSSAILILVGDVNQLPSIGPGNVLKDIIGSRQFEVVTLTEIFRQAKESRIVSNAHRINKGEFPDITKPVSGKDTDFYFIQEEDPEKALRLILKMCKERIPKRYGFDPLKDVQVLTPMKKGVIGVSNLNIALQNCLNPYSEAVSRSGKLFKIKDKVMQTINNYDREVFNGDIGWITKINWDNQEVSVDFEGRLLKYDFSELDELVPAYAISIHKSQGSEYPAVIIPVMTQHYVLLQRNMIYTGITRGKKLVVLVGTKKALAIAIRNDKPQKRYSHLQEKLERAREMYTRSI